MNRPFGVPPLGGQRTAGRLKPEVQTRARVARVDLSRTEARQGQKP
jgi:hypothetical protein